MNKMSNVQVMDVEYLDVEDVKLMLTVKSMSNFHRHQFVNVIAVDRKDLSSFFLLLFFRIRVTLI
jgi:hypothetical protein